MCRKIYYDYRLTKKNNCKNINLACYSQLTTFVIAWVLTGDLLIGATIGSIEAIAKIFLYYFHERIWNNISWAKS